MTWLSLLIVRYHSMLIRDGFGALNHGQGGASQKDLQVHF